MSAKVCPFCKEPYADTDRCPAHDLELVEQSDFASRGALAVDDDDVDPSHEPRSWRALAGIGAALTFAGFLAPSLTGKSQETTFGISGLNLATGVVPSAWALVGWALCVVAMAMNAIKISGHARRVVLLVATFGISGSAWHAYVRARAIGIALATEGNGINVKVGPGALLTGFGALLVLCAALLAPKPEQR